MHSSSKNKSSAVRIVILLSVWLISGQLGGQAPSYSYLYRVYFRDKGSGSITDFDPLDLLSQRSLDRRKKMGISLDYRDLPVNRDYLEQIQATGLKFHCSSKWMNTALFKSGSPADINSIQGLPFVSSIKIVKSPLRKRSLADKFYVPATGADLPPYDRPVTMLNGVPLHSSGYEGNGVLIAILDGGFTDADKIPATDALRKRKGIRATRDFVENRQNVYLSSSHGTAVLSILAGNIPYSLEGMAPGADYLLLRTEDVNTEYPCEEDFWAAGAEYADSTGADIISSSLGYFTFDDPSMNYSPSDLDGNTAFVTQAADLAASRGILVVNSAGNERNKTWKQIIFPADGDSVLAIGAVDGNEVISLFSSAGPSADRRVKPDVSAMGVSVPVQTTVGPVTRMNGTSFSCPVISGMAACLMQAVPKAGNAAILKVIRESADRFSSPDSLYGYGIPDMTKALGQLQDLLVRVPVEEVTAGPNPTTGNVELVFREPPGSMEIGIYTLTGKLLWRKNIPQFAGRTYLLSNLAYYEEGMYLVRIVTSGGSATLKVIRLKD